jgi:hypothetical protein
MKGVRRNHAKTVPLFAAIVALLLVPAGCGEDENGSGTDPKVDQADALTEAAPEAEPEGAPPDGALPEDDRAAVESAVRSYVAALNGHDAETVCALLVPGALGLSELPVRRSGCGASLAASIGTAPEGGGPAWRRTAIRELNEVSVGDGRARVTATVTHDFTDRNYVSVEEDVIYLDQVDGRWLLAKPSGTLYRAVGYPEPPLRALAPPG